ncbi:glutamate--cysteine ligase [Photobacterium aphoticum]|uniref:glutamate--cysteine ligase n=1 Tax=Photobacterium aphoticum TaxID=754436 RepID=UPI0009E6166E|nr:glutamate--cysteine ligase [Photobacterium aphoticum]PSU56124.1 glutamate--cysteine ligase [Photobacterium aphoticum]GHA49617.1 glutamate--cysteine ligase [Photobacterium aphoticum]
MQQAITSDAPVAATVSPTASAPVTLTADLAATLTGIRRGIEKEGIRATAAATLSDQPHPQALGAALTHPYITTDFAEAQLELITPAETDKQKTFAFLTTLHHTVAKQLPAGEVLWGASFPPRLPDESAITIADYGQSNAGRLKKLYRQGLANRYGRRMQTVSGIHYNFSLPEAFWQQLHQQTGSELPLSAFISSRYFHLIRNALRHGWVVPYLFGASPALDSSYLEGREHPLQALDNETFYLPWATSLRLSNLGYGSSEQSQHAISYNNKAAYLNDLYRLLTLQSDGYAGIDAGEQVNTSVLQMENELYGAIRPKIVSEDLRPLYAMCRKGVEYVELRSVDNNPYLPVGIDESQSHFLDAFLTYCALAPSPELEPEEMAIIQLRQELVATEGRKPGLMLPTVDGAQPLVAMGESLLAAMQPLAAALDSAYGMAEAGYQSSLQRQQDKFADSTLTPSAQLLADLQRHGVSYRTFVLQLAQQHHAVLQQAAVNADDVAQLQALAVSSIAAQQQKEAQDTLSFDDFLREKNTLSSTCE